MRVRYGDNYRPIPEKKIYEWVEKFIEGWINVDVTYRGYRAD
jgi:hypothetical protein